MTFTKNLKLAALLNALIQVLFITCTRSKSVVTQNGVTIDNSSSYNVFATTSSSNKEKFNRRELPCSYAPGLSVGNRTRELQCCKQTVRRYEFYWGVNSLPLNRYLAALKGWNCPQYKTACEQRLFAFNAFTNLMYDYFCNYTTFVSECLHVVNTTVATMQKRNEQNFANNKPVDPVEISNLSMVAKWQNLLPQIQPSMMTLDELLEPCIQVAQYDQEEIHDGSYQEVIDFGIPSCSVAWCGFGEKALHFHRVSIWTCLSPGCRKGIITIMVACGTLGVVITVVNLLIILMIALNSHLQNSQSTYKLSLAVADLLVGAIVLPVAVDIMYRLVWTRHLSLGDSHIEGYIKENGVVSERITDVEIADRAGKFHTKFPNVYENFAGFFTAVSIFVSVYTLAGAGFDRLSAIYNPLTYRKETAHKTAKRVCVASWLIAILFGLLPLFTPNLSYALVLSIAFATLDSNGLILYIAGLFVPLLVVWVVNILTFTVSKKHSKFRRQLTKVAQKKRQLVENRLAHTLRLMVFVFTVNTLPLIILLVCSLFLPTTQPTQPHVFNMKDGVIFLIVEFASVMLLFGNSLWNFFIYSYRNRDFRVAVKFWLEKLMKALCISACKDSFMLCCRSMAHTSRRRLSSFHSYSRYSFTNRKKNSVATVTTRASSVNVEDSTFFGSAASHRVMGFGLTSGQTPCLQIEDTCAMCETCLTDTKKTTEHATECDSVFDSTTVIANSVKCDTAVTKNLKENLPE